VAFVFLHLGFLGLVSLSEGLFHEFLGRKKKAEKGDRDRSSLHTSHFFPRDKAILRPIFLFKSVLLKPELAYKKTGDVVDRQILNH
jgi:hypothetical protein